MNDRDDITALNERVSGIYSDNVKYRRTLDDLLDNLEFGNMPSVKRIFESYKNDTENSIAAVTATADSQGAALSAIAQWQNGTDTSVAALQETAGSQGASIAAIASWKGNVTNSSGDIISGSQTLAQIAAAANNAGAQVSLVAESGSIKAAAIITAINGQSSASISANKINFTGLTTFVRPSDLGSTGTTVIDGGRIGTGTLSVNVLKQNTSYRVAFISPIELVNLGTYGLCFTNSSAGNVFAAIGMSNSSGKLTISGTGGVYIVDGSQAGWAVHSENINSYISSYLSSNPVTAVFG